MYDLIVMWEWIGFLLRWVHVITAIAWIGSSFYFIALDLSLNRNIKGLADGEEWQVHGGGFYHIQKYMVAPSEMPEHLTWFKWESYFTWLSGFAVLIVVYWFGADLYLLDPQVSDISSTMAIFGRDQLRYRASLSAITIPQSFSIMILIHIFYRWLLCLYFQFNVSSDSTAHISLYTASNNTKLFIYF